MRFLFVVHKNEEKAEQNSVLFHRLTLKERGLRPNGYFPLMRQPLSRFPTDNGKPSNLFTSLIFIGGFQMTETRVGYHKEVKTASFQGKSITVENLTPMLSPRARDKRKREIESCLYEVFVKYAPGRAQMH